MSNAETAQIKYIFLDIVGFTKGRSFEAQSDIVRTLNQIVLSAFAEVKISESDRILIPTGDGMCIALVEILKPYDIHILIALKILTELHDYNTKAIDSSRKFALRVGINENVDNIIVDINNRKNVAGSGINMAQRVMNCGDENHLLISQNVYETLNSREKYMALFKQWSATTKHKESFFVYQYIDKLKQCLNSNPPKSFCTNQPQKLTRIEILYLQYALHYEKFLESKKRSGRFHYTATFLLYALAYDAAERISAGKHSDLYLLLDDHKDKTIEELFDYYSSQDFSLLSEFHDFFQKTRTNTFSDYFDEEEDVFLSEEGKQQFTGNFRGANTPPKYLPCKPSA